MIIPSLQQNMLKISEIEQLPLHWDGESAMRFTSKYMKKYREMMPNLSYQPEITPRPDRSIELSYRRGEDTLTFRVYENTMDVCYIPDGDTERTIKYSAKSTVQEINKVLEGFYDGKN